MLQPLGDGSVPFNMDTQLLGSQPPPSVLDVAIEGIIDAPYLYCPVDNAIFFGGCTVARFKAKSPAWLGHGLGLLRQNAIPHAARGIQGAPYMADTFSVGTKRRCCVRGNLRVTHSALCF
jgi:hypothetical protein